MGCNCKKINKVTEKYGMDEEKSLLYKVAVSLYRIVLFLFALVMAVVITPVIVVVAMYKICFTDDRRIVLPKPLSKHMIGQNG